MRIKELREEKKLSQDEVARAIGTNQRNIGRWEKGENEPTSGFVLKLADFFQCSVDYLLGRTDNPEGRLYGQPKLENSDRMQDFIEMCFDPSTNAHAKLKETLKKMLEENK